MLRCEHTESPALLVICLRIREVCEQFPPRFSAEESLGCRRSLRYFADTSFLARRDQEVLSSSSQATLFPPASRKRRGIAGKCSGAAFATVWRDLAARAPEPAPRSGAEAGSRRTATRSRSRSRSRGGGGPGGCYKGDVADAMKGT